MADLIQDNQVAEVVRLRDEEDLSFVEIGEKMGFSEKTARRRYKVGILGDMNETEELEDFPEVPPVTVEVTSDYIPEDKIAIERFTPLVRTGDCMVTSDWHIPLHDPGLINKMIVCAKKNKLKKLIIAGDFFHMDTFSSFLPYQPEAGIDIERADGIVIMKTLCRTFDEIDIIWGNHDFRLVKKLGFKKSFEECMRWMLQDLTEKEMAKIRFSDLDYMHYYPEGEDSEGNPIGRKFRVCHPGDFSRIPLTVPRSLAIKYSCSIITAHSHHHAIGAAANGTDLCIDAGGFFSKTRTEYIQKTSAHHEWVPGFTYFKDGIPYLVGPAIGNDRLFEPKKGGKK